MSSQKNSIKHLLEDPSFRQWVRGEATEQERLFWDRWVMDNPENRDLALKAQEEIGGFALQPTETPSTDEAWDQIQERMSKTRRSNVHFLPSHKRSRKKNLVWVIRIAAVFLVTVFTAILVTQLYSPPEEELVEQTREEVRTDTGEQKTVRFSDGSEVILNGRSGIVYTVDRSDPTSIDLYLEGEAYFSVASRTQPGQNPFRVRTEQGTVSVLGTRFVVSTHANQTRVVLEEGRVSVHPFHMDMETVLEPGQLAEFYDQSRSVETRFVNPEIYTSWIHGRLVFDKAPIKEVAERLEDTFGVEVVIRDPDLIHHKISGSIESSDLEIITSALSEMLKTPIYKSDSEKVIYVGDLPDDST